MNLKEDVIPVTELKNFTKRVLEKVHRTGQPILVTQNGHSSVMIIDIDSYQRDQSKLRILEEISKGEREILEGFGVSHTEVKSKIKAWIV